MTILADLLPFLDGWRFETVQLQNVVDPAGYVRELFKTPIDHEPGFLMEAAVGMTNPNAMLSFHLVGPKSEDRYFTASPFTLNTAGLITPNGWIWCPVYNPMIPLYEIIALPDSRHLFWAEYADMNITSVGVPNLIYTLAMVIVRVTDREAFVKSWRRMFAGEKLRIVRPEE